MRELTIGRLPNNDIVIDNLSVSRQHAVLIISANDFSVCDLDSSNGTFVNGIRVNGFTKLNRNDILKVGTALVPWMNYINANDFSARTQYNQPQYVSSGNPIHQNQIKLPNSSAALTLGIIGLIFSVGLIGIILNILAISIGSSAISIFNAEPEKYTAGSLSNAKAGKVLGIIGLGIFGLVLLIVLAANS